MDKMLKITCCGLFFKGSHPKTFIRRAIKKGDIENSLGKFTHLAPYKKRKLKIKEKKGFVRGFSLIKV